MINEAQRSHIRSAILRRSMFDDRPWPPIDLELTVRDWDGGISVSFSNQRRFVHVGIVNEAVVKCGDFDVHGYVVQLDDEPARFVGSLDEAARLLREKARMVIP